MRPADPPMCPGSGQRCVVLSPLPYAYTTPLATTGGSAMYMTREIQTGVRPGLPALSSTLKAATAPNVTTPCSISASNLECFGPQKGVSTHRTPAASCHVAMAPHTPIVKLTSSLQMSGVRPTGVRWSAPPSELVSSSQMRHSLLDETMYSLPL